MEPARCGENLRQAMCALGAGLAGHLSARAVITASFGGENLLQLSESMAVQALLALPVLLPKTIIICRSKNRRRLSPGFVAPVAK